MSAMTIIGIVVMSFIVWIVGMVAIEFHLSERYRWPTCSGATLYLFMTAAVCAVVGVLL